MVAFLRLSSALAEAGKSASVYDGYGKQIVIFYVVVAQAAPVGMPQGTAFGLQIVSKCAHFGDLKM